MNKRFISSARFFTVTLILCVVVVFPVWIAGLKNHETVLHNGLISISVLAVIFLFYVTIGLYKGKRVKEDLGNPLKFYDHNMVKKLKQAFGKDEQSEIVGASFDVGVDMATDGCLEGLTGFFVSGVGIVTLIILFYIFGGVFWFGSLLLIALMYWVFYRAIKLVFRFGIKCKGDFGGSLKVGFLFSLFYSGILIGFVFLIDRVR